MFNSLINHKFHRATVSSYISQGHGQLFFVYARALHLVNMLYGHNEIWNMINFLSLSLPLRIEITSHTQFHDDLSLGEDNLTKNQRLYTQGFHSDYGSKQLYNMSHPLSFRQSHKSSTHEHITYLHKLEFHTLSPLCIDCASTIQFKYVIDPLRVKQLNN